MSNSPSPKSSDQFDALIELLATDDAADESHFHIMPGGSTSDGLRDGSGKLDFAKIRALFVQRRTTQGDGHHLSSDLESDNDPKGGTVLPRIVVEEPTASVPEGLPLLAQPPGEQPSTPQPNSIRGNDDADEIDKDVDSDHPDSVNSSEASIDPLMHDLENALSMGNKEVAELQRNYLELQKQVAELLELNSSQRNNRSSDVRRDSSSTASPAGPIRSDAFATEPIASATSPAAHQSDAERAMQFLIRTDELVWQRSRYPDIPPAPVFAQANIDAITQRLILWESIVRGPAPR
ncbi:hypothetical protein BC834DRAFT_969998 [Gloeopeniophorella convolvens]|nr:hypothetical protein BC834DRAFT_969998 [Gloeopeniophorella convolvens]